MRWKKLKKKFYFEQHGKDRLLSNLEMQRNWLANAKLDKVKKTEIGVEPDEHKEISPLPKLNPYDSNYFLTVNFSELAADAVLIIFSVFFSGWLFEENNIVHDLKQWQLIALYSVVVLALPWYLGYVYAIYSVFYGKRVMKIILWLFIIIVFFVLFYIFRILFSMNFLEDETDSTMNIWGMFSLFLIVMGPMMCMGGVVSGEAEFHPEETDKPHFDSDKFATTGALLIIVLALFFLVWWASYKAVSENFLFLTVVMFGACFAAVAMYGLFLGFLTLLDKIGLYKYLASFSKLSFPLFIVSVLVLWTGIELEYIVRDFGMGRGSISPVALTFALLLTGLVPFRLVMLFAPPLRITNFVIGIAALVFFLWKLSAVVL